MRRVNVFDWLVVLLSFGGIGLALVKHNWDLAMVWFIALIGRGELILWLSRGGRR